MDEVFYESERKSTLAFVETKNYQIPVRPSNSADTV